MRERGLSWLESRGLKRLGIPRVGTYPQETTDPGLLRPSQSGNVVVFHGSHLSLAEILSILTYGFKNYHGEETLSDSGPFRGIAVNFATMYRNESRLGTVFGFEVPIDMVVRANIAETIGNKTYALAKQGDNRIAVIPPYLISGCWVLDKYGKRRGVYFLGDTTFKIEKNADELSRIVVKGRPLLE